MKIVNDKMAKLNLTFYGGTDGVTGANFLLEKNRLWMAVMMV